MKEVRTMKLKISGSTKVEHNLELWLQGANWLSSIVFKTKELNSNRLCKAYYPNLRKMGIPPQLSATLCRIVCARYKKAKTMKYWQLSVFKSPVILINYRRDWNHKKNGVVTLWGEPITIHDPRPLPTGKWKDSQLKKIEKDWFLLLAYEIEIPELKSEGSIIGVDMGIKRMLVATNSNNSNTFFFKGGELNHRRACIRCTRSVVQSVGTRSSRRLLKRMSGNEVAVTGHLLHVASKALVNYAVENDARKIVIEELKNIRDASLNKGKDLRSKVHRWPFARMRDLIEYKAKAKGITLEAVSPKNTSRGCNKCGHVSASNRKGLHFHCVKCGHSEDADRHASKNIRARSVSIEHNSAETGSHKAPESSGLLISLLNEWRRSTAKLFN